MNWKPEIIIGVAKHMAKSSWAAFDPLEKIAVCTHAVDALDYLHTHHISLSHLEEEATGKCPVCGGRSCARLGCVGEIPETMKDRAFMAWAWSLTERRPQNV